MTPSERRLFQQVQRRAAGVSPDLVAAILRAFQRLRESMTDAELTRAIALGFGDRIVEEILTQAVLDAAFLPVRERLRQQVRVAVPVYTKTLPPRIAGEVSGAFDILNPTVTDAIRGLETRVMQTLQADVRETVRNAVEAGLRDQLSPRTIAKGLRDVIGLAPNQLRDVENYRLKLERAHDSLDALDNKLRDRRFDAMVRKARETGRPIPAERIDKAVEAYRKRRIAQNASVNAREAAVNAQKVAQRLSWQRAIDSGAVDPGSLFKTWRGVMDDRERPEHVAHEGETVPFDQPYTGGYVIAGLGDWGCRCVDIISVR